MAAETSILFSGLAVVLLGSLASLPAVADDLGGPPPTAATDGDHGYAEEARRILELASNQPGFLGFESARQDIGISVSYWASLEAIQA